MLFLYGLLAGAFLSGLFLIVAVTVDDALQNWKAKRGVHRGAE